MDPSSMHLTLGKDIEEMIGNTEPDSAAYAAPRGNAKSTLISFALPIWCAIYKKKHYIIIVSDTDDQSADFLINIRSEFEDNELLINDFGDQLGLVWTNHDLVLVDGDVRIQALGAGKKIRGRRFKQWRPDLIIGDDLENDENVASPEQRKKLYSWQTKALSKAGDRRTDKIFIGTVMHYDSLLIKLLNNPTYKTRKFRAVIEHSRSPLWTQWEKLITNLEDDKRLFTGRGFYEAHLEEMMAGVQVLWPEGEDYYSLRLQLLSDGPAAFSSEKQNEPIADEDRLFNEEWIQYYEDDDLLGKNLYVAGVVDPSLGKKGGDYSAIISGALDASGQIYILDADIQKRHPDAIASDVIARHLRYTYKQFGVETVQFQEYFKDVLVKKIADYEIETGINIWVPVKGLKTHSDKRLRIQSLQPDIKNGRIKFKRDQKKLVEQLVNFPSAENDDGPDALEMLMQLFGKPQAVAEYYKEKAHESNKPSQTSILQQLTVQGRIGGIFQGQ